MPESTVLEWRGNRIKSREPRSARTANGTCRNRRPPATGEAAKPRSVGGPRVVRGHHLYPGDARLFLLRGGIGLGESACACMAAVEHDGQDLLRRGFGARAGRRDTGGPQYRPEYAVHECGLQGARARPRHPVFDGRPGSIPRQYLHRAAVAVAESTRRSICTSFATVLKPSVSSARGSSSTTRCAPTQLWADVRRGMLIATAGRRREQATRRSITPYAPGAAGGGQSVEPFRPTTFAPLARERRLAGGAPPANLPTSRLPRARETVQNPP